MTEHVGSLKQWLSAWLLLDVSKVSSREEGLGCVYLIAGFGLARTCHKRWDHGIPRGGGAINVPPQGDPGHPLQLKNPTNTPSQKAKLAAQYPPTQSRILLKIPIVYDARS